MQLPAPKPAPKPDVTIALINIVFLLLVFFIVAGPVAFEDRMDVQTAFSLFGDGGQSPERAVFLDVEGRYRFDDQIVPLGQLVDTLRAADALPQSGPLRLVPDHRLEAQTLIRALDQLNQVGLFHLSIVTVRGAGTQ